MEFTALSSVIYPVELNLKFQRLWGAAKFEFKSLNYELRDQKLTWKPVVDKKKTTTSNNNKIEKSREKAAK